MSDAALTDPQDPPGAPVASPGRLRSAWMVLRGTAVVPDAIRAEWAAYRFELDAILENLHRAISRQSAKTAHDLRARVKELEAELSMRPEQRPQLELLRSTEDQRWAAKAALWRGQAAPQAKDESA